MIRAWYVRVLVRVELVGVRGDSVWWSRARGRCWHISRGNVFFRQFGLHGICEVEISTAFYSTGTENHGKSDTHGSFLDGNGKSKSVRELFEREREIEISSGTVRARQLERYSHGNGTTFIPRAIPRGFSRARPCIIQCDKSTKGVRPVMGRRVSAMLPLIKCRTRAGARES